MNKLLQTTLCVLLGLTVGPVLAADNTSQATPAFYPADALRGKARALQCIACHGTADLQLGAPPIRVPLLGGQRAEAIFLALRDYKNGSRASNIMTPIAATLSEEDMRDVGAYLSGAGPHLPKTYGADTWAHEKVHHDCTACHGESGMGVMPGIPVLTGQYADYLIQALNAYRDGVRKNPTMATVAAKLSADEIRKLAEYFAMQKHLELAK